MTDHPRFESVRSAPDEAHLGYHGGHLVNSVLRLVDRWRALRASRRSDGHGPFDPIDARAGQPTFAKIIEGHAR